MEIERPTALRIVERIQAGKLGLLALHSAHWSRPFVEAMNAVARQQAIAALPAAEQKGVVITETDLLPRPLTAPRTPNVDPLRFSIVAHRMAQQKPDWSVQIAVSQPIAQMVNQAK